MSRIIVLNGPSSAGKTTLARALRDRRGPTWVAVSIDSFFAIKHRDAKPTWAFYKALSDALFAAVMQLADGSLDVIVDTVFERPELYETAKQMLNAHSCRFVAVSAPLPVLEAREQARGDRRIGQARDQHERVFAGMQHDISLDTSALSIDECVDRLIAV